MKKILIAIFGAAMMLTSCDTATSTGNGKNTALGDSIAIISGKLNGYQNNQRFGQLLSSVPENEKGKFDKREFLRGVAEVINCDTTNIAYLYGLQAGFQMFGEVYGPGQADIVVKPGTFLRNFKEAFMADSVGDEMQQLQMQMQMIQMRMQQLAEAKRENEIKNSPEYKENTAAGEKYATARMGEGYTKAESGLVYKVENPGDGEQVKRSDRVVVKYTGKHTNGEVFDASPETGTKFSAAGVVPGFSEGLQLLGKGGKATLVIPGELAYGINGAPHAGIGPNETLVFDIEVIDINPAN